MVHSTTSVFCVSILQKWTLSNRCPMNIWPRFMIMTPFPCPAILSFPALLQLRQLAAACWLGNLGFIRACASQCLLCQQCPLCHCATVPKPLCYCASQCPLVLRHTPAAKCLYSVSSSEPEPRSDCHLPHTPSNAHIHFGSSH